MEGIWGKGQYSIVVSSSTSWANLSLSTGDLRAEGGTVFYNSTRSLKKKWEKEEKVQTENLNLIISSVPIIVHMKNYTETREKI